jgi:shikimate kinase
MKTNVALIGFMGTGKTAVGKSLAQKLNLEPVEMDDLIEQKAGKSIPDIFAQDGEIAFRELEIAVTKEIAAGQNQVIACGGGVVLNQINIDRLRQQSRIIYLTASPEAILERTAAEAGQRPLLEVEKPARTIREMLTFREPFYKRAADIEIDTSRLGVDAVAEEIVRKLKEDEGFGQ